MAFRADEEIKDGRVEAERYLLSRLTDLSERDRSASRDMLHDLFIDLGPVIDTYPTWHPLVSDVRVDYDILVPSQECGYEGLDHSIFFAHGFITCPYNDGQNILDSVNKLKSNGVAYISAERLDVKFYSSSATAILVKCEWDNNRLPYNDKTIPKSVAVPLMLEKELIRWTDAQVAETWETMHPYFLGRPHGKRSSLFINQETGQTMKKIWESLINTGMYGPIYTR